MLLYFQYSSLNFKNQLFLFYVRFVHFFFIHTFLCYIKGAKKEGQTNGKVSFLSIAAYLYRQSKKKVFNIDQIRERSKHEQIYLLKGPYRKVEVRAFYNAEKKEHLLFLIPKLLGERGKISHLSNRVSVYLCISYDAVIITPLLSH